MVNRPHGRRLFAAAVLAMGWLAAARAGAQEPDTLPSSSALLPGPVARQAATRFNGASGLRATTATTIESGRSIDGDVAILEAPLRVAGVIRGSIVAINGSVALLPGARVEGDILIVGGTIAGHDSAFVGGEIRAYQPRMRYRRDGELLVAEDEIETVAFSLAWLRPRRERSRNGLRVRSFSTYNRVEGLPIYAGPVITREGARGSISAELFGIIRSADNFDWTSENVGHRATLELRTPHRLQLILGGRLHDVVEAVEPWQLSNTETGLATFFLHRDFRDWFNRHGGSLYAGIGGPRSASLVLTVSREWWASRRDRDPWTLFRDGERWRANPTVDDGRFNTARLALHVDTRNDVNDPWVGWYVTAEAERGAGRVTQYGARSPVGAPPPGFIAGGGGANSGGRSRSYGRAMLDVRRYNRLSPETQLNGRLVLGGRLGGGELPLQRRFSLGGPGTLPGYDFRQVYPGVDVFQCSTGPQLPGRPAECERIALAQLEYRTDLGLGELTRRLVPGHYGDAAAVVFVDAGRGWRVGETGDDGLAFSGSALPPFHTFRSDVGAGIDFSIVGLYVAKSVSISREPANFFLRVRHRF